MVGLRALAYLIQNAKQDLEVPVLCRGKQCYGCKMLNTEECHSIKAIEKL